MKWRIKEIKNIYVRQRDNNNKTLELEGERPTTKVVIPPLDEQIRAEDRIDEAMRIFFEEME